MAAPAATSWPSAGRAKPSKVMTAGAPALRVPKLPDAPRGAVASAPPGMARRGSRVRRRLRHSGQH
eukprot:8703966-Lingulodinium_polyedra.AAC.1